MGRLTVGQKGSIMSAPSASESENEMSTAGASSTSGEPMIFVQRVRERAEGAGRPHSTASKLGRLLHQRHLKAFDVTRQAGVPPRILTEYLAARKPIRPNDLIAICTFLQVHPSEIVEEKWGNGK